MPTFRNILTGRIQRKAPERQDREPKLTVAATLEGIAGALRDLLTRKLAKPPTYVLEVATRDEEDRIASVLLRPVEPGDDTKPELHRVPPELVRNARTVLDS